MSVVQNQNVIAEPERLQVVVGELTPTTGERVQSVLDKLDRLVQVQELLYTHHTGKKLTRKRKKPRTVQQSERQKEWLSLNKKYGVGKVPTESTDYKEYISKWGAVQSKRRKKTPELDVITENQRTND